MTKEAREDEISYLASFYFIIKISNNRKKKYYVFNERYITREVDYRIPLEKQILIWNLVKKIEGEKDYLQILK